MSALSDCHNNREIVGTGGCLPPQSTSRKGPPFATGMKEEASGTCYCFDQKRELGRLFSSRPQKRLGLVLCREHDHHEENLTGYFGHESSRILVLVYVNINTLWLLVFVMNMHLGPPYQLLLYSCTVPPLHPVHVHSIIRSNQVCKV